MKLKESEEDCWFNTGIQCLKDEAKAILGLIENLDSNFIKAIQTILACEGKVIITGVGKSGHIGAKIAATMSSTGTPSFYVNPLDIFHGDLGVITSKDVVLAISNSGKTDELLRFLPYLIEHSIPVIAMTGNPSSELAQNSNIHLNSGVRKEACPLGLAPTSSTTATLALGDALACALMQARGFKATDFAHFHPGGTLGKRLLTKAKDVMRTEDLPVLSPETNLGEALIYVSKGRLGLCVAVKNGNQITGIITDGDIRRAIEASRDAFFDKKVCDIMTKNPKTASPETKITDIDNIMNKHKIHSVLIASPDNELLGIVDSFSINL